MRTSFFAAATPSAAPTNDDLTDATIDQATKRTVTSTEGARDGSHRRAAIIETTKIGDQSARGTTHPTTRSATPAASVHRQLQRHHSTNKYSGASR